jgi:DNA-binding MarR family transcriptional regulator
VSEIRVPLERRFGYRFHMISRALGQEMLQHVSREYGLNIAEYRIMTVLANRKSPSIRDIAANTDLDKAHITRALGNLVKRGLVEQKVDAGDRRLRDVRLTAAGQGAIRTLDRYVAARQQRLERRLTKSELQVLWKVLAVLSDEIENIVAEQASGAAAEPRRLATRMAR